MRSCGIRVVRETRGVQGELPTAWPPLSPPLNLGVGHRNAEIGHEVLEERRRETLGEDVSELARARDVQNAYVADADLLAHKVDVELDVLRSLVMNWIPRHVRGGDVVAEHDRGLGDVVVKFASR